MFKRGDQAEGLRRILSFSHARTIAVVAGTRGAGATSSVINLARALSRQGRRVVIVDENGPGGNVAQALGLRVKFDLKHVIEGYSTLDDALLNVGREVSLLPASRAAIALPKLDALHEQRAVQCFAKLDRAADVVLIDARNDADEPSAFVRAAQEVITVVSPGPSSITGGYAAVKRMNRTHGRKAFHVLVNRVTDLETAEVIHRNMSQVATQHLDVTVEFMGAVPHDDVVSEAAACYAAAVDTAPLADVSRCFTDLASAMLRWRASQNPHTSGLDNFMQRAIHGSRLMAAGAGA
jgi:flagellar biosynthesis protein FlhG